MLIVDSTFSSCSHYSHRGYF